MEDERKKLFRFLGRVKWRLRLIFWLDQGLNWILAAFSLVTVLFFTALFVPVYQPEKPATAILAFFVFLSMFHMLFVYTDRRSVARKVDKKGMQERFITALENIDSHDEWSVLQREDACKKIEHFRIKEQFPLKVSAKKTAGIITLILLCMVFFFTDTPAKKKAFFNYQKTRQMENVQEKITTVEKTLDELEEKKEITAQEREAIRKNLEEYVKELKAAGTEEEIKKAKERMEKKLLNQMEDNESKDLAQAADNLSDNLHLEKQLDARQNLETMAKENDAVYQAKDALEELLPELSEEQLDQLMEMLNEQMGKGEVNDETLANILSSLGEASAMELAMQVNSQGTGDMSGGKENGQSGENNSGSGESNGNENNSGSGEGNGNGSGSGQGNGSGNGSGNGQGNGSGNGSGNGMGNGGGNGGGSGYNYGSKTGLQHEKQQKENEQITIRNETGNDENLTGKKQGKGKYKVKGGNANTWSGSRIGYQQVAEEYASSAYRQIEQGKIPDSMEDVVKSYFSEIAP